MLGFPDHLQLRRLLGDGWISWCVVWSIGLFVAGFLPFGPLIAFLFLASVALGALRTVPRKEIDASWGDLLAGLRFCLFPTGEPSEALEASVAALWSHKEDAMSWFCVRAGMDQLLLALALPRGSEAIFAPGITIPSVVEIFEAHGLTTRAIEPDTTSGVGGVTALPNTLEGKVTSATKILVITHVFGNILNVEKLIQEAHRLGLFVVEDAAQAFIGSEQSFPSSSHSRSQGFRGHESADAAFVSFGLTKTGTACGGAMGHVRDEALRRKMRQTAASFPEQSKTHFLNALWKATTLRLLASPHIFGLFTGVFEFLGKDYDELLIKSSRGFPGPFQVALVRFRPSAPLLQMLRRRLVTSARSSFDGNESSLAKRRLIGDQLTNLLVEDGVRVPAVGSGAIWPHASTGALMGSFVTPTWWLLPIEDTNPHAMVRKMRRYGFDPTASSTQMKAIASVAHGGDPDSSALAKTMSKVIYLPLTSKLSLAETEGLAACVSACIDGGRAHREPPASRQRVAPPEMRRGPALATLVLALSVLVYPRLALTLIPGLRISIVVIVFCFAMVIPFTLWLRRLSADPSLRPNRATLRACADVSPNVRAQGAAFWREFQLEGRVDGTIVITGATGFVGKAFLFATLVRADDLGINRIVLVIRPKRGESADQRLVRLREDSAFAEVLGAFERLVCAIEGDTASRNLGRPDDLSWPYETPPRAVVHCAGDISFHMSLQQAATSAITGSLQAVQFAARWQSERMLFVSTAFVHASPPPAGRMDCEPLLERLVGLRDFDPWELYRDMLDDGRWSAKVMRDLGFPNTYTFSKAIAEHLFLSACLEAGLDGRIVRPAIVGPAWAAPMPGWNGDRPSTVTVGAFLYAKRFVKVFRCSWDPAPIVPVDMVAGVLLRVLLAKPGLRGSSILHAAVDAQEAALVPSFAEVFRTLLQTLILRGDMLLPEAGFLMWILRWCESPMVFGAVHFLLNRLPLAALGLWYRSIDWALSLFFGKLSATDLTHTRSAELRKAAKLCDLPSLYIPFSSPTTPWTFRSRARLPIGFSSEEYSVLIARATLGFERDAGCSSPLAPLQEVQTLPPGSLFRDLVVAFCYPGPSPFVVRLAAFIVRRALSWAKITIVLDAPSLAAVAELSQPLVLCPTHRSLLDFVVLGSICFQLRPQLPMLSVPHVAADAEFGTLPLLGRILAVLGAFYVRRGGGSVQRDPALRAEVGRVFRNGHPLEVFLEGARSRGRRFLRLRTGFLRALCEVAQRPVALVPVAMGYELLPEDDSFFEEMRGCPRPPLRTVDLLKWVYNAVTGKVQPHGQVYVRFGVASVMDTSTDLRALLHNVQGQLVDLTTLTTLHARALAEVVGIRSEQVLDAFRSVGILLRTTDIVVNLTDAQRWALALQAAIPLRRWLPPAWAAWLVESACPSKCVVDSKDNESLSIVINALTTRLQAAEAFARKETERLRASGLDLVSEAHLLQRLHQSLAHANSNASIIPPPLLSGAACVVASELGLCVEESCHQVNKFQQSHASPMTADGGRTRSSRYIPLWPAAGHEKNYCQNHKKDVESLERWGFSDTRFEAKWCDGRPAVKMSSKRYKIGGQPLYNLWTLFQKELEVPFVIGNTSEFVEPPLPPPPSGLLEALSLALPQARISADVEARLRAGTGQGLADIWLLRSGIVGRVPDAVVRPESEEEIAALLAAAVAFPDGGFAVVPVGGRTNVTSATKVPETDVDPRPFVALDMRSLSKVCWVNKEDGIALVEAGITGVALQEALKEHGANMGMEPDSMELSTLGGWIATRASGMKRARYGNIEEMVVECRVATPMGILWQSHDHSQSASASSKTAFGRCSVNVNLPGLMLGSEGCLGVIVAAVVRVRTLPEVLKYESVAFRNWSSGVRWMREVARLPAAFRPASCRLMDSKQLALASSMKSEEATGVRTLAKAVALRWKGISLDIAAAATLVFEGSAEEVTVQQRAIARLVASFGGMWGGASAGESGYALTFAIAYLRDFGLDHKVLSESLETFAPWSAIGAVWPAVMRAVESEHRAMLLPGKPFMSHRLTQLYDEGGVLYMYIATSTAGMEPQRALDAFHRLEDAARGAVLAAGGSLSHHHGVGKHRAPLVGQVQSSLVGDALRGLKRTIDPNNVLGAANGVWSQYSRPADSYTCPPIHATYDSTVPLTTCHITPLLKERFEMAASHITRQAELGGQSLPEETLLRLYALYKQGTVGEAPSAGPWSFEFKAHRKWSAWNDVRGMDREEAMKQYIVVSSSIFNKSPN